MNNRRRTIPKEAMMRTRSLTAAALAVLLALALLGAGCYGQTPAPSGTEPGTTEPGGAGGTAPSGPAVTIQDFSFSPPSLEVKIGDKVTWTNQDSAPHNVLGDAFKSPDMPTGGTFTYTFDKAGTFTYKCGIHPSMTGTVIVK
jgi:plastocyanin